MKTTGCFFTSFLSWAKGTKSSRSRSHEIRSRLCWSRTVWHVHMGSRDTLLVEHWTHDRKVVSSNSDRSGRRIFFSRVNFLCWLLFGVCSTPVLLQWHVKDPGQPAKSPGGRLHLNKHTAVTQRSRSGLIKPLSRHPHSVGTYQENELTCNWSGNTHPQSSQLAEPLWTEPSLKSAISVCELIPTLKKKKKKSQVWNEWSNILPKSWQARKKPPPQVHCMTLVM